ncbi:MAG: periplasmic heavy metal sensor [Opitutaceae bacterium]
MSVSSNKRNKIWMITGLVFGLILVCIAVSSITSKLLTGQHDWQQHDHADGHQWLHKELNLTPEEAEAVDEFEPEYRQQRAALQAQFQAKVEQLRKEITTSDEFSDRAKQMIHELHIVHGQLQELSIHHYYQMMHVLPADKQARLRDIAAKALSVPQ